MFSKDVIDNLEELLSETQEKLSQSTGGESVCTIHKYGSPSDYLKFVEGKEFIIRRVVNLLKKGSEIDKITMFLSENEIKLDKYKNSPSTSSSAWQSYSDGGIEAIQIIKQTLKIF